MSDTPRHYARTFEALKASYKRLPLTELARLTAQICKADLVYVDPATDAIKFREGIGDLAPRLAPPVVIPDRQLDDVERMKLYAQQMARVSEIPPPVKVKVTGLIAEPKTAADRVWNALEYARLYEEGKCDL